MSPEQELDAWRLWGEREICKLLATRVRRARAAAGESQQAFADRAGIPLRTYKRFETDGRANLETFIHVLKALGRTQYLPLLFPSELPPRRLTLDDRVAQLKLRSVRPAVPPTRDSEGVD